MPSLKTVTCVIEREGDGYVALCPDLDIASEGDSPDEARKNLIEAVELFFETADSVEIRTRLATYVESMPIEVRVG